MGFWRRHVLPYIVDAATGVKSTMEQRAKIVPRVAGRVVELGFGSGHNLALMDPARVERVWAVEPVALGWKLARGRVAAVPFEVEFIEASAEEIPLDDGVADTVLVTYGLCTIPDPLAALAEARRLLRPAGELVFCEHGLSDDPALARWQDRLQPIWGRLAGGCHLNRRIPEIIAAGGFTIRDLQTALLPGPKPLTYTYWGTAG